MAIEAIYGDLGAYTENDFEPIPLKRNKSSRITLNKKTNVLRKDKANRKPEKAHHEFASLAMWNTLLQEVEHPELPMRSPAPIALDARHRVYMTFMEGLDGEDILSPQRLRAFTTEGEGHVSSFVQSLGRVMKMKEQCRLLHDDFQLRHLLMNGHFALIDVEKSKITSSGAVEREHRKMHEQIIRRCWDSNVPSNSIRGSADFERGYYSAAETQIDMENVMQTVRTTWSVDTTSLLADK